MNGAGVAASPTVPEFDASALAAQETEPAQAPATQAAPAVDPTAVVATVNGQPITEADLALAGNELSQQFARLPEAQRRAAALSAAIEIKIVAAKAIADGVDKDPDFQRRAAFLQERALHGEMVEKQSAGSRVDTLVKCRWELRTRHLVQRNSSDDDPYLSIHRTLQWNVLLDLSKTGSVEK